MKLKIKNFQLISEAELEFPIGITAIIGPSNSGKTSTIRAIYSLLKNPPEAKSFIKHGKDKAEVEIETDRMKVKWTRTPKESTYEIDGVAHQKVGRTDLFELVPDNDFYLDEDGSIVNIQDEWSSLFPFDRTDSQVYKLFEDIFAMNENDSTAVMKKIKEDESETKRKIADMNSKLIINEDRLSKINSFINSYSEKDLSAMRDKLQFMLQEYQGLDNDCNNILACLRIISDISKIKREEFDFSIINKYTELDKDVSLLEDCILIVNREVLYKEFDFSIVSEYTELDKDTNKLVDLFKSLSIDIPEDPKFDFNIIRQYQELDKDCENLISILKEVRDMSEEEKEIQKNLIELKEQLDSMETCPLCGQTIKEKI